MVESINHDGTYGIAFDDGDHGRAVRGEHVCRVRTRPTTYYAQLLLCFSAKYLGEVRPLCYVRWLHTASAVAEAAGRAVSPLERRGPFETYRWALNGQLEPWYGVVSVRKVMYRVHMVRSLYERELFRLNTDVWLKHL